MSRIYVRAIVLAAVLLAGLCGWVMGLTKATKDDQNITQTMRQSEEGYLAERFTSAYRSMPAEIAVWEGTNLVKYLGENSIHNSSPEKIASETLVSARLAQLFQELGDEQQVQAFSKNAFLLFNSIKTNLPVSPSEVVSNLLAAELVKREYRNDHK